MKRKFNLTAQIFTGLFLGVAVGLVFMSMGLASFTTTYIKPFGTIYINLLKLMVVPIVLFSIADGVIALDDIKKVGSIGVKTFIYYMCTTAVAVVIGLAFASAFRGSFPALDISNAAYEAKTANVMDTIVAIFPNNILAPMVSSDMLPVIVISLFIGFGVLLCKGNENGKIAAKLINALSEVSLNILTMIIKLTPIGVFCLMCDVVAVNGAAIVGSLGKVVGVAYLGYITHVVLVYGLSVHFFSKMSLVKFLKGMMPAMMCAFTTTSSNATLPLTIECSNKLGAEKDISAFVLPLGATINMDGTAIYMGVTSVFIASCYGVELTLAQMATIVLTATVASIGTAGVSGAGMIMLAMVLESVGLPVAGIGLIAGVDKLFDMGRTTLNITGDATCALAVTRWETGHLSTDR